MLHTMGHILPAANVTCNEGWMLIGGKCLLFLHSPHSSTPFKQAQSTCKVEASQLLSIVQIPSPKKSKLKIPAAALEYESRLTNLILRQRAEDFALKITGIPFIYDTNPPELSHIQSLIEMLPSMKVAKPFVLPFVEIWSATCWVLESGYYQSMSDDNSENIKNQSDYININWGLKAIDCNKGIDFTTFVCEKPPFMLTIACLPDHFTCDDNTCILSLYVCDDVSDCLNGEDENGCPESNYTTAYLLDININHDSKISCARIQNQTTDQEVITYTDVHSVCDGLHICDIIDEELCSYRNIGQINIPPSQSLNLENVMPIGDKNIGDDVAKLIYLDKQGNTIQLYKWDAMLKSSQDIFDILAIDERLHTHLDLFQLPCRNMDEYYSIYEYCIIHSAYPCIYGAYSDICRPVVCSGMFKCREYACIRLSSVCDGHADCPLAEDEHNCFNISCPIFLVHVWVI